jgi:hypothetical protein
MTALSRLCLSLLLAALSGLPAAAQAELYRWVDAEGRVHYTDTPPPPNARKSEELQRPRRAAPDAQPAPAADGDAQQPRTPAEQEAAFRKRQLERAEKQAEQERAQKEAETKKRNCESARARLAGLQAGGRITRYNAQGELEYLSDQEIQGSIGGAEQSVREWCN